MNQLNTFCARYWLFACALFAITTFSISQNDREHYIEYKGKVVDKLNTTPLSFAHVMLLESNIATVTNSDGEFSIKIPEQHATRRISAHYIGYHYQVIDLSNSKNGFVRIELEPSTVVLPEISVISTDADALIQAVFQQIPQNYPVKEMLISAFYRESIRKNRAYVSLSEAVVEVHKQSYTSYKSDAAKLNKARKKVDYSRLDTLVFKLMGGPYNNLQLDVIKNPELVFTRDMMANYDFDFDRSVWMDNHMLYVLNFKQKDFINEPLYHGKLYIDANTLALKSAVFSLNNNNKAEAAQMFILKKPYNAKAELMEASYRVDYIQRGGKWYFSYSRIELGLKINWRRKLFHSNFHATIEMAATNWDAKENKITLGQERLKTNVILSDEASGFTDTDFWGEYNVIEPEKSIESAIRKIQRNIKRGDD